MNTFPEEHESPRKNFAAAESASLFETPEQDPRKQTLLECGYSLRNFCHNSVCHHECDRTISSIHFTSIVGRQHIAVNDHIYRSKE